MKGLFIINPSSGRQNFQDKLKEIAGTLILEKICSNIEVFYTEKQNDALNRAVSLKPKEYDFVVAVGGDGTLNEVINGVIISHSNIPVAVISAGTVNDFATYLKLPQNPNEFCEMIKSFHLKKVDVGRVNGKYFINVVAAGMLTDIGFKVAKDKKAALGKLAYYAEGAIDLPKQFGQIMNLRFTVEDEIFEEEALLFMVANSQSVGGFREFAPQASTSDGKYDVLIIKKMEITQVIPLLISILQGNHVNHPSVEYFQATKMMIENLDDRVFDVDYDGEKLIDDFPLEIELMPGAIQIVVPDEEK